jgi:hypothetical protein
MSGPRMKNTSRRVKPPPMCDRNPGHRPVAELHAAILAALADGPQFKWKLREMLHEPEHLVYRALRMLRDEGRLKVVGTTLDRRMWALIDWQDDTRVLPGPDKIAFRPRTKPPADSWWAKGYASWDEFTRAQRTRQRQAGWGTE